MLVKIGKYIGFCVYHRSYLLWPPVHNTIHFTPFIRTDTSSIAREIVSPTHEYPPFRIRRFLLAPRLIAGSPMKAPAKGDMTTYSFFETFPCCCCCCCCSCRGVRVVERRDRLVVMQACFPSEIDTGADSSRSPHARSLHHTPPQQ